jgi:RimJ/RimL family protein N-acetyltransferase
VSDPPYRIVTERLVLRCWDPRDAPLLKNAVDSSLDELRPWMPWAADEPQSLEEKVEHLRRSRGRFDLGEAFVYGIFDRDEREVVGGTGFHARIAPDALELGYWIRSSHVGGGWPRRRPRPSPESGSRSTAPTGSRSTATRRTSAAA